MAENNVQVNDTDVDEVSEQTQNQSGNEDANVNANENLSEQAVEQVNDDDNLSSDEDNVGEDIQSEIDGLVQESANMQEDGAQAEVANVEEQQVGSPQSSSDSSANGASQIELEDMSDAQGEQSGNEAEEEDEDAIELLKDVELNVKIELGRAKMYVEDVIKLTEGSVVELDKLAGDPVDIYVNDRLVARGEVLVLNENFCVRVNQIVRDVV